MSFNLPETTKALLAGCVVPSDSGVSLYTPDGHGNYRALWTRDFACMLHGAGDLIPMEDARACIEYLIAGARPADGWIPDRVEPDGRALYTAGFDFPALPNLDNGPFLVLAADEYLNRLPGDEARGQFTRWENALRRGLCCLPVDENSIIVNVSDPPHSPYGFTDTVAKTGRLAMETLLYWQALGVIARRLTSIGQDSAREKNARRAIESAFARVFTHPDTGMLLSATAACRQIDVWASCYALSVGFPLEDEQKERIAAWLAAHYDEVTEGGQLRHLPAGQFWQNTFVPVERGRYQNGAFWATPIEWLCAALIPYDRALAERALDDLLAYFDKYGVFECVNGESMQLDTYVASATNALAAARRLGREV